jgi:branched-chain amino acid transport system substrate-binding protein
MNKAAASEVKTEQIISGRSAGDEGLLAQSLEFQGRANISRRRAVAAGASALTSMFTASPAVAQAETLWVGQVGPFSVLPTPDASQVRDGIHAALAEANRTGGIHGRRVELFTLDDAFDTPRFLQQFRAAIARRPLAMLLPIGSSAVASLLASGTLDQTDTVVLGTIPGAEAFRHPGHPRLFHVCAGDRSQIERIMAHCRTLGLTKVHMVAQPLAVGSDGVAAMDAAVKGMQGMVAESSTIPHEPDALQRAMTSIVRRAPSAVVFVGTPRFMADALATLRIAGGRQPAFALSYLPAALAVKVAGLGEARGLGITQIVPNPNGQDLPLQRAFQSAMRLKLPQVSAWSPFHMEGYLTARVLLNGLRGSESALTPTGLAHSFHTMGEVDLGGLRIDFRRGNTGSTWTDIGVVAADGRLMY